MKRVDRFPQITLDAVRRFLVFWTSNSCNNILHSARNAYPESLLEGAYRALTTIRASKKLSYDPYVASGYSPSENQLSNALSIILDPNSIYDLGTSGLHALLDSIDPWDEITTEKIEAIRNVLEHLSSSSVSRESSMEDGRCDIRIDLRGLNGKKCSIIIENKRVRDALEIGITPQTVRYEAELRTQENGGAIGLGIYLTPDGKAAKSKLFASVSCERFGLLPVRLTPT